MSDSDNPQRKEKPVEQENDDNELEERVYRLMQKAISEEFKKRDDKGRAPKKSRMEKQHPSNIAEQPGTSYEVHDSELQYECDYDEYYGNEYYDQYDNGQFSFGEAEPESELARPDTPPCLESENEWLTDDDSDDEGAPLADSKISEYLDRKISKREAHDKMKEKLGRHKRPKNVKHGKEVKVNTEIYRRLKKYTKIRDIKLKRLHKICLKTAFAGARLAESCRKMQEDSEPVAVKAWGKALYNNTTDVISFAGQVSYGLNMLRVSSKNFYQ